MVRCEGGSTASSGGTKDAFNQYVKDNNSTNQAAYSKATGEDKAVWDRLGGDSIFGVSSSSGEIGSASNQTGLAGLSDATISGAVALQSGVGEKLYITGGSETGHETGDCSHGNGCKLDFRPTEGLNDHLEKWNDCQASYGPVCKQSGSSKCVYEENPAHWDCSFGPSTLSS